MKMFSGVFQILIAILILIMNFTLAYQSFLDNVLVILAAIVVLISGIRTLSK